MAQNSGGTYDTALHELRAGTKRSHWMWFVFPQVAGLGMSPMAQRYAVSGLDEAWSYLAHPLLGPRLHACCEAMLGQTDRSAQDILGGIDAVKLRSSMTLFLRADPSEPIFEQLLNRYFDRAPDSRTDELLTR